MIETILQEELLELRAKDLYRQLRVLEPVSSVRAVYDQRELLLFCGNDYLGLTHHPRVMAAAKDAVSRFGVGSGAARLISGTVDPHVHLEEGLASLKRKEKALVFSAGYLANLGVLAGLAGTEDLIVMDKLCHASLIDAARLSGATLRIFPHKDYDRCEAILQKGEGYRRKVLVTDTVFSMDGDLADLERMVRIKGKWGCLFVADDAHATGVFGKEGRGALEDAALEEKVDVVTGTLSKALGCLGGFAAASSEMIDYLVNRARPFIFATSLPPLLCVAAREAIRVVGEEPALREKLWRNARSVHAGLIKAGFQMEPISSPILPVVFGSEKKALGISESLLDCGIFVPAVRYPAVPKGKARLRVTISATHGEDDRERLIEALKQIAKN